MTKYIVNTQSMSQRHGKRPIQSRNSWHLLSTCIQLPIAYIFRRHARKSDQQLKCMFRPLAENYTGRACSPRAAFRPNCDSMHLLTGTRSLTVSRINISTNQANQQIKFKFKFKCRYLQSLARENEKEQEQEQRVDTSPASPSSPHCSLRI